MLRKIGVLLAACCAVGAAPASAAERLVLNDTDGPVGLLSTPRRSEPVPAVILVHDSLGTDRRADLTVRQLRDAGVATLEVELYAVSADGAGSTAAFDVRAEAEVLDRARRALAAQPGIDSTRVAALGFGRGAHALAETQEGKQQDWSARVYLYPDCAALGSALVAGTSTSRAPLLLLHGDVGAGDPPCDCVNVANRLEEAGVSVRIIHYRGAAHGWDLPPIGEHLVSFQPAPVGRGTLRTVAWPELAEMSATQTAGFLAAAMNGRLRPHIHAEPNLRTPPGSQRTSGNCQLHPDHSATLRGVRAW
ncbi:dienelactone hydrolase family protein [Falsiroseomonas sp. E2-1-a20]|uniref:dienelactone hydrolase family protein n=1 Tax=Falsiroseomonas sp. E2-1-a20 TaxID=3239300 RepID=UPI003F35B743